LINYQDHIISYWLKNDVLAIIIINQLFNLN
jgi:hypothetical protein